MPFKTVPALILAGQRTKAGTRQPPSQLVFFSDRNGVMAASGQLLKCGPLSVEYMTMVSSAIPSSSSLSSMLADVLVVSDHHVVVIALAALALVLLGGMRAEVHGRRVVPHEERLFRLVCLVDEAQAHVR